MRIARLSILSLGFPYRLLSQRPLFHGHSSQTEVPLFKRQKALFSVEFSRTIKSTKIDFERIRIPLAKFEPARRHQATDSAVAWPGVHPNLGLGWGVSNDKYVSRRQLADDLLSALEILKRIEP